MVRLGRARLPDEKGGGPRFNPTMVRLGPGLARGRGPADRSFNPTMVRLGPTDDLAMPLLLWLVSIPLWCD